MLVTVADKVIVNCFRLSFDSGWLFVIAGCALLWAALVLPAIEEYNTLQQKLETIEFENELMTHRIVEYQSFFDALLNGDEQLRDRVVRMQSAGEAKGDFVVFDPNAAKTPLQWLRRRTAPNAIQIAAPEKQSILVRLTEDDRRLWVAGFGGLILFFGLVQSPRRIF